MHLADHVEQVGLCLGGVALELGIEELGEHGGLGCEELGSQLALEGVEQPCAAR